MPRYVLRDADQGEIDEDGECRKDRNRHRLPFVTSVLLREQVAQPIGTGCGESISPVDDDRPRSDKGDERLRDEIEGDTEIAEGVLRHEDASRQRAGRTGIQEGECERKQPEEQAEP